LEWTVDGELLRDIHDFDPSGITMLQPGAHRALLRTENLRRLRGDDIPPPVLEPRYHRTRLDRLLHLRGTPYAPSAVAFEDGRVGLIYCPCEDLDCGVLSARVEVTAASVTWHDVGWQVPYEPCTAPGRDQRTTGPRDLVFDRDEYEALIHHLLEADWVDGLPLI
jgi:hypothetical protein